MSIAATIRRVAAIADGGAAEPRCGVAAISSRRGSDRRSRIVDRGSSAPRPFL
jgi:hypothetical protein